MKTDELEAAELLLQKRAQELQIALQRFGAYSSYDAQLNYTDSVIAKIMGSRDALQRAVDMEAEIRGAAE